MATLHVHTYQTPKGMRAVATYYRPGMTPEQTVQDVIERSDFHYSCGRKVYDRNVWAENAIKEGDFQIDPD